MNKKNDDFLCQWYPLLFVDRNASMNATCMCWGFDCGDGWFELIKEAAAKLHPLIEEWLVAHPYQNEFPWWIFSRYNLKIDFQWRPYSFLAIWQWCMIGMGWQQPDPWWPRASQIKEKYGTLRFYMTSSTKEMDVITDAAERESAKTCEECGRPGRVRGRGWLYTSCLKHKRKD